MRIITISREFGSGGRELGKRIADILSFDYYDREIVSAISQSKGLDADYVERELDRPVGQRIPVIFRHSFIAETVMNAPQISLLLEQKNVIEKIASIGKDFVIVGRSADVILKEYHPFRVFVCASTEAKVKRCIERAEVGEALSQRQIEQNMRRIDKNRMRTCELIGGGKWGDPRTYDMTINTTNWDIKSLASAVAEFAMRRFGGNDANTII